LISPLSIYLALSFASNGAEGVTREEISEVLEGSVKGIEEFNKKSQNYLALVAKENQGPNKLSTANAIFTAIEPLEEFINISKSVYDATTEKMPSDIKPINDWCSKKTNGKIGKILENIPKDCEMIILNAVYFFGEWARKFKADNTYDAKFNVDKSNQKNIKMMSQKYSEINYFKDENIQVIELPYSNDVNAVILLPVGEIENLLSVLDGKYLSSIYSGLKSENVNLHLPKFKIEYQNGLNDSLKILGMKQAFLPSANFSKLCKKELYVSNVIHKAFIEVNEKGTEAAAVTSLEPMLLCMIIDKNEYVEMCVNRPFIFCIRHKKIDQLLFLTIVQDI